MQTWLDAHAAGLYSKLLIWKRPVMSSPSPNPQASIYFSPKRSQKSFSTSAHKNPTPNPAEVYERNVKLSYLSRAEGHLEEAQKLFDKMRHRDTFSYATMIAICLKNHDLLRAERLFRGMPSEARGVVAETAMIDGYMKAGLLDDAQDLFEAMPHKNVYTWTSMISGYFSNGRVAEAVKLFDQMPVKNVVSWTNMVQGYALNGLVHEARRAFDQMQERNVVSWIVMVKCYVDNGMIVDALSLFYQMPSRNLYAWNVMISGCLDYGKVYEAICMFNSMPTRNTISWTVVVTGLAKNGMINQARQFFDRTPDKDVPAWNAMITAYANQGLMVEAKELFQQMPVTNVVICNAMIKSYAINGNGRNHGEAFRILGLMLQRRSSIRPNNATITSLIALSQCMAEVVASHSILVRLGFEKYTSVMNTLITAYSKLGDLGSACNTFVSLEHKDTMSWRSMMFTYANHGHVKHAFQTFAQLMRLESNPLDEMTFLALLIACGHTGLVEKGRKIFNSMRTFRLEPRREHYACLIDMLARSRKLGEVVEILSEMPKSKIDGVVVGASLNAFILVADVGIESLVNERLVDLVKDDRSGGGHVLIANAFAVCKKYDKQANMWKQMKESKIEKVPGFSFVEVKGKICAFFSGKGYQLPELEDTYKYLRQNLQPPPCTINEEIDIFSVS